jgi:hypothetical protein
MVQFTFSAQAKNAAKRFGDHEFFIRLNDAGGNRPAAAEITHSFASSPACRSLVCPPVVAFLDSSGFDSGESC